MFNYRVIASIMTLSLASDLAIASSEREWEIACSPTQVALIEQAVSHAKTSLREVEQFVAIPSKSRNDIFIKWFGISDVASFLWIETLLENSSTKLHQISWWCPVNTENVRFWEPGQLARLHPTDPNALFFSRAFFNLPPAGEDSQSSTVVHEVLHLGGADLHPEVYDQKRMLQMAKNNPAAALRNAQTIEFFIENALRIAPPPNQILRD